MDSIISYRHYMRDEAVRFFNGREFYSRSSRISGRCAARPDVIRAYHDFGPVETTGAGRVTVVIEVQKIGRTDDPTWQVGFRKTGSSLYWKSITIKIKEDWRTVEILSRLFGIMDKITGELPILLYATAHTKQVRDYLEFMLSAALKLRVRDLAGLPNIRSDTMTYQLTQVGLKEKPGVGSFYVMPLPQGEWVAWVDGDDLIPVFASELKAHGFMRNRLTLYEGFSKKAYDQITVTG